VCRNSVAAVAKEGSSHPLIIEGISIIREWELDHSSAIGTQRWASPWKLSVVSMKELCPT